ncbi:MAG: MOSC N-terminal beta barrel domain-containing protein [Bacteroidetes bacterium]|nr:MOSC N-terminal beta barrel domain-containing protein [Bacteroidota bacterium]
MSVNPYLQRISIYPVKSLDGIFPETAVVCNCGCLKWDREFAIFDRHGKYVNGKSHPEIHLLRAEFNLNEHQMVLSGPENKNKSSFHLLDDRKEIDSWLSDFFNQSVTLLRNTEGKFMDDPELGHVTVAGIASFDSVSSWFSIDDPEEVRRRLRVTLEIAGLNPFAEDGLFTEIGRVVRFKIGDVNMMGMRPRERCVVPTRHPETAQVTPAFPKYLPRKEEYRYRNFIAG